MKTSVLTASLLFFCLLSHAQQDTIKVEPIDLGKLEENTASLKNTHVIVWNSAANKIISESDYLNGKKNGVEIVYNFHKGIARQTNYKNGKKEGEYIVNFSDGPLDRKEIYKDDTFLSGQCFNHKGDEIPYYTEPFNYVEQMPSASFDMKHYLFKNVKYPQSAKMAGIVGRVYVVFIVKDDGTIFNAYVGKSLNPACDEEALRVVMNMPAWQPGTKNGKKVNVYLTLPIEFK